jgi:hypothetical protein
MNFFKNIWKRIRMRIRLEQMGADKDIIEAVKKGVKRIEKKETLECQHSILRKLLPGHFYYQCGKCKMVFYIHGADGFQKEGLVKLSEDLLNALKVEPKKEANEMKEIKEVKEVKEVKDTKKKK